MAKIITDYELVDIIHRTVDQDLIDDHDNYCKFLNDLADVVTKHFGGERKNDAEILPDNSGYAVGVHWTEEVPDGGGVYKDYDKDVTWKDGKETE